MRINIIHTIPKEMNGVYRYSSGLINGLRNNEMIDVKEIIPLERSFSIYRKNIGKWMGRKLLYFQALRGNIVHSTNPFLLTKNTNIVTIHDISSLINKYKEDAFVNYFKKIIDKCSKIDTIISHTKYVKKTLLNYSDKFQDVNIKVIPIGVEMKDPIGKNPYPNNNKLHLFSLGNFGSRKRFDRIYSYVANMEDVELYHIGSQTFPGKYSECISSNNVHYLGYRDNNTISLYMKYADRFILDSIDEGYGLPPLEAMVFDVQPIVSDIPVFHETMKDKAYFFNDEESFTKAILSPKHNGLSEFVSQYNDWIQKYISVYEEMIQ